MKHVVDITKLKWVKNRAKDFLHKIFCKHDYALATYGSMFFNLRGETYFLACRKCGKIKRNSRTFVKNYDE